MPGLVSEVLQRVRYAASIAQPAAFSVRPFRCPICGPSALMRLSRDAIGVRCLRCAASAITLSLVALLRSERPAFCSDRVYELSSRGPLFEYLRREIADFTFSEYYDDVAPGEFRDGVQCQDVQRLTHPDAAFDLVTSTEVFEHVPDDRLGFREVRRVLRPGGTFLFTVPLADAEQTEERARLSGGRLEHLREPAYHHDRIRGRDAVLVYRDYGRDIVGRLREAGFSAARIERRFERAFLAAGAPVIVASA